MAGTYKIKYHKSKCIGAGSCAQIAPETWSLDKKGKAVLKKSTFSEKDKSKNIRAARSCPVNAIEIYDSKGKKIV